jgi:hypothetical protein
VNGLAVVGLVVGLAAVASGCGGSSATAPSGATSIVEPPNVQLQGCTYETDGSVPAGQPEGIQPSFPAFSPDQAADAALQDIRRHGGTGLINGFIIPSGTNLYAGPDAGASPVTTVEGGRSLLFEDPVYWKTSSGAQWLASFVACGGSNLYWVEVSQISAVNPDAGAEVSNWIKDLLSNPPYTKTGQVSALPIKFDGRILVWSAASVPFAVGRGEYLGY